MRAARSEHATATPWAGILNGLFSNCEGGGGGGDEGAVPTGFVFFVETRTAARIGELAKKQNAPRLLKPALVGDSQPLGSDGDWVTEWQDEWAALPTRGGQGGGRGGGGEEVDGDGNQSGDSGASGESGGFGLYVRVTSALGALPALAEQAEVARDSFGLPPRAFWFNFLSHAWAARREARRQAGSLATADFLHTRTAVGATDSQRLSAPWSALTTGVPAASALGSALDGTGLSGSMAAVASVASARVFDRARLLPNAPPEPKTPPQSPPPPLLRPEPAPPSLLVSAFARALAGGFEATCLTCATARHAVSAASVEATSAKTGGGADGVSAVARVAAGSGIEGLAHVSGRRPVRMWLVRGSARGTRRGEVSTEGRGARLEWAFVTLMAVEQAARAKASGEAGARGSGGFTPDDRVALKHLTAVVPAAATAAGERVGERGDCAMDLLVGPAQVLLMRLECSCAAERDAVTEGLRLLVAAEAAR